MHPILKLDAAKVQTLSISRLKTKQRATVCLPCTSRLGQAEVLS